MQESKKRKIKCRCCGQYFQIDNKCPFCGFHAIVVIDDDETQVEAFAAQWRKKYADQIVKSVGVVYNKPASWKDGTLVPGDKDYMKLGDLAELNDEFRWNDTVEFASFGGGEEASLKVYMEYLDGSKREKEVKIQLPSVRGITWKTAVRMAESGDGAQFAVGIPERFTQTETVTFRQ